VRSRLHKGRLSVDRPPLLLNNRASITDLSKPSGRSLANEYPCIRDRAINETCDIHRFVQTGENLLVGLKLVGLDDFLRDRAILAYDDDEVSRPHG
jgi:hypothetical protein